MNDEDVTLSFIENGRFSCYRLYYYQGNFYYPLGLPTKLMGLVKREIKIFYKQNMEMIKRDRKHSDYKTKLQIFDEQFNL